MKDEHNSEPTEPFTPDDEDDAFSAFLGYYAEDQEAAWGQLTHEGGLFMFRQLMELWGRTRESEETWKLAYMRWADNCRANHRERRRR